MIIKSIELVGYQRLSLNHINRIYIDFSEKIQLILGSNGSGKSSLLKELSPLPANHQEYNVGGSKRIVIEHRGSTYILTSNFEKRQTHSCLKDNVELNPGGTYTIQKDVVYKEFGITTDMHELFTGQVLFSSMSVAHRRLWFTLLSNTDYTYALNVYNKLREKLRDNQGALKINQSRLLQESKKLIDPELESNDRNYIEYLETIKKELIDKAVEYYAPIKANTNTIVDTTRLINDSRLSLKKVMTKYKSLMSEFDYAAPDIVDLQTNLAITIKELTTTNKSLEEKERLYASLQNTNLTSIEDIIVEINTLQKSITALEAKKPIDITVSDYSAGLTMLDSIYDSLVQIIRELKPNPNKEYSKEKYLEVKNTELRLKDEITLLESTELKHSKNIQTIEHAKEHNKTTCPECKYVWSIGYSEADYIEEKKRILDIQKTLVVKREAYTAVLKHLEEMTEYFGILVQYSRLIANYPLLNSVWNYIGSTQAIYTDPPSVLYILEKAKTTMDISVKIKTMSERISFLNNIRESMLSETSKDMESRLKEINDLHETIFQLSEAKRNYETRINTLNQLTILDNSINMITAGMSKDLDSRNTLVDNWLKQQMTIYIRGLIELIEAEINSRTTAILSIDRQRNIVANLEAQNVKIDMDIKALKILVAELSPKEGLIAKGMQSFINIFIIEINNVIRQVWLYPLELVLLETNSDEQADLDYKFAIKVKDLKNVSDIELASTAMKEIINLSFKVVCMRYLGMSNYPIFLDEFGASMDSAHRATAIQTIKDLIYNSNFSQIFVISHHESSYGSFKNAEINILCSNNIVIPNGMVYNQNTIVES